MSAFDRSTNTQLQRDDLKCSEMIQLCDPQQDTTQSAFSVAMQSQVEGHENLQPQQVQTFEKTSRNTDRDKFFF